MKYCWKLFVDLSASELYEILKLRQEVFILEQNCIYADIDGFDKLAWHLLGFKNEKLEGYVRVIPPGFKYKESSIGRVLTIKYNRGNGLGKTLIQHAITHIQQTYPKHSIRISAQLYLKKFYRDFGFKITSDPYDEDGILHVEMLLDL